MEVQSSKMSRSAVFLLFVAVVYIAFREVGACGDNEEFKQCSSPCQRDCNEPLGECIQVCTKHTCQCKTGYCRDADGKCVEDKRMPN